MMGVELAHHHHAFPLRNWHEHLAASGIAELTEGQRRLILSVGRKVACPQHEARLALHGGQHLVELPLEAAALRRSITQKHARLGRQPVTVLNVEIEYGQLVGQYEALNTEIDVVLPLLLGEREGRGEDVEKLAVVGGHFRFRSALEVRPHLPIVDVGWRVRGGLGCHAET